MFKPNERTYLFFAKRAYELGLEAFTQYESAKNKTRQKIVTYANSLIPDTSAERYLKTCFHFMQVASQGHDKVEKARADAFLKKHVKVFKSLENQEVDPHAMKIVTKCLNG